MDKIVGPGNGYVAYAKKAVSLECSIDFVAGPTEIVSFAARFTNERGTRFIASDLVAQSEHDPEALPIFITSRTKIAQAVVSEVDELACPSISSSASALRRAAHSLPPEAFAQSKKSLNLTLYVDAVVGMALYSGKLQA